MSDDEITICAKKLAAGEAAPTEIVAALLALAECQELRRRAEEGAAVSLRHAAEEGELVGYSVEEIELHFEAWNLMFGRGGWNTLSCPSIQTRVGLYVPDPDPTCCCPDGTRDTSSIGYYLLITDLDGTDRDDVFVLKLNQDSEISEE